VVKAAATDPGETVLEGFGHWLSTWSLDYANTVDIGFPVPGDPIRFEDVPDRAFTSPDQRPIVQALFDKYNDILDITPEMDRQFAELAAANIRRHPIRYRLLLPIGRTLDMWFRPRTEMLPLDTHFWQISEDPHDSLCSIALGLLNLGYVMAAAAGAWLLRRRLVPLALLLTYPIVRSLFLATTFAAEDRYTMECLPIVFVLAGGFLSWWQTRKLPRESQA